MFSPFVKGLMCATLMFFGASGCSGLIAGLARHAPITYLLWYVPGILVVVLALLLFTSNLIVARLAFWILLILGLASITAPLHSWPPGVFHVSSSTNVFCGLLYLFPCAVALLSAKRHFTPDV